MSNPETLNHVNRLQCHSYTHANDCQTYNRKLAQEIGLEAAIFLNELVEKLEYFEATDQLVSFDEKNSFFYLTQEDVEERTSLSRRGQEVAIAKLIDLGFIEKILRGVPPRRYFRLIQKKIINFLEVNNRGMIENGN